MDHDERHIHLGAARLLRQQLGLCVMRTDESLLGGGVQLLGPIELPPARAIQCLNQIRLSIARVRDDFETDHRYFLLGSHALSLRSKSVILI